jgi:CRISPR-associated protein Cmr2
MSAHLLLFTLGPVQGFIAESRRTRDLWYGSHLLSELARGAARALVAGGAQLIFPALAPDDPELQPCPGPLRPSGVPPLGVANKILAEVPDGIDPAVLARSVREETFRFWRQVADEVRQRCSSLLASGIAGVWDEQIDSFLEIVASWAPLGDYVSTRRTLEQAVAARKNLRDFSQWTQQRGNVPKSSLDGARETVLAEPRNRDARLVRKYRIADGEQLDAVGLVKRAGGEPEQFVPVVNVAFAAWLDYAARHTAGELATLKAACASLGLARVQRPDLPCAQAFPFDASILLRSRWRPVFEEQGLSSDPEGWGRRCVVPLLRLLGEPYPYVACLVADGDRMGQAIDWMHTPDEHRRFSKAVSQFAAEVRRIVEQQHRGVLVYSGGDDVLAFLPVPEVLACADELHRRFEALMQSACREVPKGERPTLSVGIGIGHVLESLGDLLELGREAERLAKRGRAEEQPRNAIAVVVDKRSGGKRSWRARWDEWGGDPIARLRKDMELLEQKLSTRKVHEIASTPRRLPAPDAARDDDWAQVLALEVQRSLARVEAGAGALEPSTAGLTLHLPAGYAALYHSVSSWVDRMLIAREFAAAEPRLRQPSSETVQ